MNHLKRMKQRHLFSTFLCVAIVTVVTNSVTASQEWDSKKTEHFIVFYTPGASAAYIEDIAYYAETYYQKIASDFNFQPMSASAWTWGNRIKIYLYPCFTDYLNHSGESDWTEAVADYVTKSILSFSGSRQFLECTLPHEITHLMFREIVGKSSEIPMWIDEGIAQWQEGVIRRELHQKALDLFDRNGLLSLKDIALLNVRLIDKKEHTLYWRSILNKKNQADILILSPDVLINTYYIEAGSAIGYLIERFGMQSFLELARQLRDGKKIDEALAYTYPDHIRSLSELDRKWRTYLDNTVRPTTRDQKTTTIN